MTRLHEGEISLTVFSQNWPIVHKFVTQYTLYILLGCISFV